MTVHHEFYDLLGVKPDATQEEIKRAFRAKAKECHPDHHPGDAGKENAFKRLSIAYTVLSDPETRARYDETGEAPPINDILTEAYGLIIKAFQKLRQQAGDDILYADPFKRMKDALADGKSEAEEHIKKLNIKNDLNNKLIKKITHKTGGNDSFLHQVLLYEKQQHAFEIEKIDRVIAVMDRAREVLDEFTFKADKRPENVFDPRNSSWPTFGLPPGYDISFGASTKP